MELYAMKPIDLVFPVNWPIPFLQQRLAEYQRGRVLPGEHPLSYMGLIGAAGALLLVAVSFKDLAIARRLSPLLLKYAVPCGWLVALSGVAGPLALAALLTNSYVLRSSNRFSIFLVCALYLFLAECARRVLRNRPKPFTMLLACAIALVGFADLPPRRSHAATVAERAHWKDVQKFVSEVEKVTGPNAMIFVLPVLDFPEAPPRLNEGQYTPLSLYVARSSLRFSYGNMKGDPRDRWQAAVEALPAAQLAAQLQEYGFSGVVLFRAAYADHGASIIEGFAAAGYPVLKRFNMVFISLPQPKDPPSVPPHGWGEDRRAETKR
jgi:phosphoglycerol transferase